MVTLFRKAAGDDDTGSLGPLLDQGRQPAGRVVLDLAGDLPQEAVVAAAREVLIVDQVDQVDVALNGRLVGVMTLSSLLPARVSGRGEVRGQDAPASPTRSVAAARPALVRRRCADCGALVCVLGRQVGTVRCPAGHRLQG